MKDKDVSNDVRLFHIPNTWNCIQSAIWQLEKLQPQLEVSQAILYLESAKKSLTSLKLLEVQ